ncbi:phage portal protein [Streptomyces sp. AV19]|uniref:phage portal protein n=3 Tax=Streptomyces sp. AV19 TaxID=2793068 RepID=UPI002413B7DA|nr:phage portal protein [Streptomyces sp. AV19]MDG4535318.1 phage portal protein [Streptomyces sp. AV19]
MKSPLRTLFNKAPVPYVAARNLALPWRQPTGAEAQMRAMGSVGTLFAIVNRTSNATAQVEWKLWRKAASGLPEDRVEVTRHAALDLWNKPNGFYTRQENVEIIQQHVDLTGEGWWVIARNPRSPLPLELWPVRPDRMQPVPHPIDFLSGYMYTGPGGEQIALRTEDVIQLRMPNPLDPYRGMGPVQAILSDLDSARYSAEWNRNFFLNGAEPGGIIQVDKRLSDDEFDELTARWNEQHKGIANAHRVAVIEQGQWVDRKLSQRDMQFAELRSVSRDVIREAFGIPKFALGDVDDVNRATAEASKAWFAEYLTVPRLERIKGALNNDLLPLYGPSARELEFDYCSPVPADSEAENAALVAKATAAQALIEAGAYGPEVLAAVGLPEIAFGQPGADQDRELLIRLVTAAPAALAPVILPLLGIDVPQPPQPAAPAPSPAARTAPPGPAARLDIHHHAQPPEAPVLAGSLFDLARAHPRHRHPRARAADQGDSGDLEAVREQFEEHLARLLEEWEDVAEAQYEQLAEQIETAVDDEDAAALAALSASSEQATAVLRSALGDMATTAAQQMAAEAAAQGVTVTPPTVDEGLRDAAVPRLRAAFGSELVEIAAATAALLAADAAAAAGREALRLFTPGMSGRQVADAIVGFLRGLKGWFRRDQLGGALHRAQNLGRLATLEAAPRAVYEATEVLDANTCGPCADIDGVQFETLAAARAAYGAGPYRQCEGGIRCRGTVVARWDSAQ